MKLTVEQKNKLRDLMLDLLKTQTQVRIFLDTNVGGRSLDALALGSNLDEIVWGLIRAAETGTPPFLDELVTAFLAKFAHDAEVQKFSEAIKPPAQRAARTVARPYYACFLPTGPFVDRDDLRPALEYLHDHTAHPTKKPRILVVTGDPNSGKSHTKHLLNHLGVQYAFQPALVDFSRWTGGEVTPVHVGQRIAQRLKCTVPPVGDEQLTRWSMIFFDTVVPEIGNAAHWLVIDFGRVNISKDVAEFIDELATQVTDAMPNMRLVLLGYTKPLTTSAKRIVEQDSTREITETELSKFFAQFYSEYGPQLEDEELTDRIAGHVPEVLNEMKAADAEKRYKAMEDKLSAICDEIGKQA